jgi:hypothetical protein
LATSNIVIEYVVKGKDQLAASNKELEKAEKANNVVQKETDQTTEKFAKQEKQLKKSNSIFASTGDQLKQLGNRFTIAGKGAGDLASGMFVASKATSGTTRAMKVLKVAIASTGIGLLIVALGSLKAAFTSSEEGQNKFAKIMASIGVIVGNVSDIFANIGERIISAFENPKESIASFSNSIKTNIVNRLVGLTELLPQLGKAIEQVLDGEFSEAAKTAGDAVAKVTLGVEDFSDKAVSGYEAVIEASKDFVAQTKQEVAEAQRLADLTASTDKLQREFLVKTASLEGKVADLRLKGRQEDEFTAEQRLAFLKEANDLQNELIETEAQIAKNRAEEIRISNTFSKSTKENLDAEAEAESNVFRIETKRLNQQRTLQREINTTSKQAQAELDKEAKEKQDAIDKENEIEKDLNDRRKSAIEELTLFRLEQSNMLVEAELEKRRVLLDNESLLEEERASIIEQSEATIADIKLKNEQSIAEAKVGLALSVSGALQQIAGEGSVLGKTLALAEIAYSTGKAIAALTAASQANPANAVTFGGAGIAQYAAGIAIIGANIASAKGILSSAPKFREGGYISGNSHDYGGVNIEAEGGEYMARRESVNKYGRSFFESLNNLEIHPDVISGLSGGSTPIIVKSDNSDLINEYRNRPINNISISEEGITLRTKRNNSIVQKKVKRYTT